MAENDYPIEIGGLFKRRVFFQVPQYQRQYCWSVPKELRRYQADLSRIWESYFEDENEQIFLGAVVLHEEPRKGPSKSHSEVTTVIDGQQRLTTIYLTMVAIMEYGFSRGWIEETTSYVSTYLVSDGVGTKGQPLIEPTHLDMNQFNTILGALTDVGVELSPGAGPNTGDMLKAYKFIKKEIVEKYLNDWADSTSGEVEIATWHAFLDQFLSNFVIVDITLSDRHNPNEVFDRLNESGKRLAIIDLVRNNVFQRVPRDESAGGSDNFYSQHWLPFEEELKTAHADRSEGKKKDQQVDGFFFPFALNKNPKVAKTGVVTDLKKQWTNTAPRDMVAEMREYIPSYFVWLEGEQYPVRIPENYSTELTQKIGHLHQLGFPGTALPFLMRCVLEVDRENIDQASVARTFSILESFLIRRSIAYQEEGSGYHAIFKRLWTDTNGDPELVREKMPTTTKVFPTDETFAKAICEVPIYGKRFEKYCLIQYEQSVRDASLEGLERPVETTDHISPQTPKGLRLNAQEREEFLATLHLWGNLLPMSKKLNSTKSNRAITPQLRSELARESDFATTKQFLGEFDAGGYTEWTAELIRERSGRIANWALQRWPSFT